jgi:hypothetical protein
VVGAASRDRSRSVDPTGPSARTERHYCTDRDQSEKAACGEKVAGFATGAEEVTMAIRQNSDGSVTFTDSKIIRVGALPVYDSESIRPFRRIKGRGVEYWPARVLGSATFMDAMEGLPLIVTHESKDWRGFVSNARFDGEWVRGDVTATLKALIDIVVRGWTELSLGVLHTHAHKPIWIEDRGYTEVCDCVVDMAKPYHLALVDRGRVRGARLNL